MQISVIIPTFNRIQTLPRALDSVLAQTMPAAEVIVVDDGSSDGTADLIASRYSSVICLRQENQGVSAARNAGIRRANSEWIALLDSDDAWQPNKLQRQLETLQQTADNFYLCHSDEIWIRRGRRVNAKQRHKKYGGWIYAKCLPLCSISPSAVIIHRSLFDRLGYFDESFPACEDYDFWLRVCARYPVLYVDEPLTIKYGGHSDQLSRRYWGMDRFRVDALEKALRDPCLCEKDRRETLEILVAKLGVLESGARKRANEHWAEQLAGKRQQYKKQLARELVQRKVA